MKPARNDANQYGDAKGLLNSSHRPEYSFVPAQVSLVEAAGCVTGIDFGSRRKISKAIKERGK